VHGDPNNPGNVRMTADQVALIDWDESHVDVPDLDLVLPDNAASLDDNDGPYDIAAQASAAWVQPTRRVSVFVAAGGPVLRRNTMTSRITCGPPATSQARWHWSNEA